MQCIIALFYYFHLLLSLPICRRDIARQSIVTTIAATAVTLRALYNLYFILRQPILLSPLGDNSYIVPEWGDQIINWKRHI